MASSTKLTFNDANVNTASKRTFETTLFHDGDVWQILPYDAAKNGAKASDAKATDDSSPVLRVQRVVGGALVGNVERVFISSLYRSDETILGVELPKTGKLNILVRQVWDNPAYVSDEQALQAIITQAAAIHPDLRFTVSRKPIPTGSGDAVHQTMRYGKQVPLKQMNWN